MNTTGAANSRFSAIDGWRGVSAQIVATYHYPKTGIIQELILFRHGWIFVDFFFV